MRTQAIAVHLAPQRAARAVASGAGASLGRHGCTYFLLAVQRALARRERGAFRENPRTPFIGMTLWSVASATWRFGLISIIMLVYS